MTQLMAAEASPPYRPATPSAPIRLVVVNTLIAPEEAIRRRNCLNISDDANSCRQRLPQ